MTETCKTCWWQEGGRCYIEPCERLSDGRSTKLATERCDKFESKRFWLSKFIPTDKLIILSELNEKK